jgi:hypothetical protein
MVIELRLREQIDDTSAGTGFGIRGAEHQSLDSSVLYCTRTHGARL